MPINVKRMGRRCAAGLIWALSALGAPVAGAQNTSQPQQDAACAKPVWPQASIRLGQQGTVLLKFLIDADGRVAESKIAKSSGFSLLDAATQNAMVKCRFKPAYENGKAVKAWINLQYVWTIEYTGPATDEQWKQAREGAKSGDAQSQYQLAMLYLNEGGSNPNVAEAVQWIKRAAAQNHPQAQSKLGFVMYSGEVGRVDLPGAAQWFRKAADQGVAEAQHMIGEMLLFGRGIAQDPDTGLAMLRRASAQNYPASDTALGMVLISDQSSAGEKEEGVSLLRRSAAAGDMQGKFVLGLCYEKGRGLGQDLAQAETLYRQAAQGGHKNAARALERLLAKRAP